MKCVVRKIRSTDVGFDTEHAILWPWMVFDAANLNRAQCWATHGQAMYFATTGQRPPPLSAEERRALRERRAPALAPFYVVRAAERIVKLAARRATP